LGCSGAIAQRSLHLAPHTLAQLQTGKPCPLYITHTKPSETQLIVEELRHFDAIAQPGGRAPHDISWLQTGQEFEVRTPVASRRSTRYVSRSCIS